MSLLQNIFIKIGVAVSSVLMMVAGVISPAPQVNIDPIPTATTTVVSETKPQEKVVEIIEKSKPKSSITPITDTLPCNERITCPAGSKPSCSTGTGLLASTPFCIIDSQQSEQADSNQVSDKDIEIDPNSEFCNGKYWKSCSEGEKSICLVGEDPFCIASNSEYCNGEYWKPCPEGKISVCPTSGNPYCKMPVQPQTNTQTTPPNTTFCNGEYWNKCPTDQDFVCPVTGDAYCQYSPSQSTEQDQAKVAELKALEEEYEALQTQMDALKAEQATLPCLSFITGEMASRCNKLSLQIGAISDQQLTIVQKEALLEGIYLPLPITSTPTSGVIECSWDIGGTIWRCSSGSPGNQTYMECSWSIGGNVWYCH